MRPLGFPRKSRLLRAKEFASLHRLGRRTLTGHFIVYIMPNRLGLSRLGVSISARAGSAVERNRLKRLLREYFRINRATMPMPADIHITVKRGASALSASGPGVVQNELGELLADKKSYLSTKKRVVKKAN